MDSKYCPDCKETKRVDDFHRSGRGKDGRRTHCKPCTLLRYRAAVLKAAGKEAKQTKRCFRCQEDKPVSEFHYHNRKLGTRQTYCKRCRSHNKTRYDTIAGGKESIEYGMIYCPSCSQWKDGGNFAFIPTIPNRHYGTCSDCRKAVGKRWRTKSKAHLRAYGTEYRKTEQCKLTQTKNRHKRKSGNANHTLTVTEWEAILRVQNSLCLSCGGIFCDTLPPTKDHIIPATKGGGLTLQNCQALCLSCNSSKNDKDTDYRPDDWWAKIHAILAD